MQKHEKAVALILNNAVSKIEKCVKSSEQEATEALRKMYKGKKVKCICFDAWIDGDDYYFDDKLLDIQAYKHYGSDINLYVTVTFMYKSIFAKADEDPKEHTFYLEKIERVEPINRITI